MNIEVQRLAMDQGITRLCHFTPARNLYSIFRAGSVVATKQLADDVRAVYHPTDLQRLDGFTSHVCCSVEYPNAWYLRKAIKAETNFREWVVLFIDVDQIWRDGVGFCPRNASARYGELVDFSPEGFTAMYAEKVLGAYNRIYTRTGRHLRQCPTDNQAEILIPGSIALDAVHGFGVASNDQARAEYHRLRMLNVDLGGRPFIVAPNLFDAYALKADIERGRVPEQVEWHPGPDLPRGS